MNYLLKISEMNNAVRAVSKTSETLYMTALNAMFHARKASKQSSAFSTVTAELRKFSHDLNTIMESLSKENYSMIKAIASLTVVQQQSEKIEMALSLSTEGMRKSDREQLLRKKRISKEQAKNHIFNLQGNFSRLIKRLHASCKVGESLALLAQVETVSKAANDADLLHTSNKITKTVEHVSISVQKISRMNKALYAMLNNPTSTTIKQNPLNNSIVNQASRAA